MGVRDDIVAIPDADLRNAHVAADYLIFMDFEDAPQRVWTGWGDLEVSGHTWTGTGSLIGVSEIPASMGAVAQNVTLTLEAATSEMQGLARGAKSRVNNRNITIYQQFFDVTPNVEGVQPWSPLIPAFAIYTGKMNQMSYSAQRDGDGSYMRKIELTTSGLFSNRNAPANGRWTDSDQQRRYGFDLGCSRMPLYASYSPIWTV